MKIDIGKTLQLDVDESAIWEVVTNHSQVREHCLRIWLRNTCMDAHASIKAEDYADSDDGRAKYRADSLAKAQDKLAAIMRGEVRTGSTTPRASSIDPVSAEALRLARVQVGTATRGWENGKAATWFVEASAAFNMPFATAEQKKALIAKAIEAYAGHESFVAQARANVEGKAKLAIGLSAFVKAQLPE